MSMQRHCEFYKATDNNWYMELAHAEYGGADDSVTYGPFADQDHAERELRLHANPGSSCSDDSGTQPVPTESRNGTHVRAPRTSANPVFRR